MDKLLALGSRSVGAGNMPLDAVSSNATNKSSRPKKAKKVPIFSLLFNHEADKEDGLAYLSSARELLEVVREKLNPIVQADFEERMVELQDEAANIERKKGRALPGFIYVYLLNPKRFKAASKQYLNHVKLTSERELSQPSTYQDSEPQIGTKQVLTMPEVPPSSKHRPESPTSSMTSGDQPSPTEVSFQDKDMEPRTPKQSDFDRDHQPWQPVFDVDEVAEALSQDLLWARRQRENAASSDTESIASESSGGHRVGDLGLGWDDDTASSLYYSPSSSITSLPST